ncbi:DNA glycosylase [Mycena amicta]|nr:DNA glycosylase [Mycena amicta]
MWLSLPIPPSQLRLALVLPSGQSFRWRNDGSHYSFCLHDRVVVLKQDDDKLYYRTILPDPQPSALQLPLRTAETTLWINDYFNLSVDLAALYAQWQTRDPAFSACHFSPPLLSHDSVTYHPFPTPQALAAPGVEKTLRDLGFGYRAKFIQKTAQMLVETHGDNADQFLVGLRNTDTASARQELLAFLGVGRKVADCVLLMSLDKHDVVPVDTHVLQIAVKNYGFKASLSSKQSMTPKLYGDINTRLVTVFGEYAGWAQAVLFASDLKAFSAYDASKSAVDGLPTPPPTPALKRKSDDPASPTIAVKRRRGRS